MTHAGQRFVSLDRMGDTVDSFCGDTFDRAVHIPELRLFMAAWLRLSPRQRDVVAAVIVSPDQNLRRIGKTLKLATIQGVQNHLRRAAKACPELAAAVRRKRKSYTAGG
jgi:hypothetical protein